MPTDTNYVQKPSSNLDGDTCEPKIINEKIVSVPQSDPIVSSSSSNSDQILKQQEQPQPKEPEKPQKTNEEIDKKQGGFFSSFKGLFKRWYSLALTLFLLRIFT